MEDQIISIDWMTSKLLLHAKDRFVYANNVLYYHDQKTNQWHKDDYEYHLREYIKEDLYKILQQDIASNDYNQYNKLRKYTQDNQCVHKIIKEHHKSSSNKQNEFDANPYLFGFANGVFDIEKNIFRPYQSTDHILTRCDYDYKIPSAEDVLKINTIINRFVQGEEKRYLLWQILASCLIKKPINKFIYLHGDYLCGKTTLMLLLISALTHRHTVHMNKESLCEPLVKFHDGKAGILNNMGYIHDKRCVIIECDEYDDYDDKKINGATLSYLASTRPKFSKERFCWNAISINMPATIFFVSSKEIPLSPNDEYRRNMFIDFELTSKFVSDLNEVNLNKNIFYAEDIIEDTDAYANAFIYVLLEKAHQFIHVDHEIFKV